MPAPVRAMGSQGARLMTTARISNEPFWLAGTANGLHPPLDRNIEVEIAVVGGGIVGVTAAYLLARAGKQVALLEARGIGRQATGRSTAKVTSQHGALYAKLAKDLGESEARRYAEANQSAVRRIGKLCRELGLQCDLKEVPAFVYARDAEQGEALRQEAETAGRLGLPAAFVAQPPLPFPTGGALRFDDQLQFDPYRYLQGLIQAVDGQVQVFENTRVQEVEQGEPCRLQTTGGTVTAAQVIVATQLPIVSEGHFFTKAHPYAHPVAAARIPSDRLPAGMFISSEEPVHSFRGAERDGEAWLVAAGGRYKPGHADEQSAQVEDLRGFLRDSFGITQIDHLWTSEDFDPVDGVPFVGRAASSAPNLLVATGFGAWGISNGTVAAEILCEAIQGRSHPSADLFDATRSRPWRGAAAFVSENVKAGMEMAGDRLLKRKVEELAKIEPGQGGIVKIDDEQLAVFRQEDGQITALSAICTHMGCVVGWNAVDRTWDCPCHGSRFDDEGEVLYGPAVSPLARRRLD